MKKVFYFLIIALSVITNEVQGANNASKESRAAKATWGTPTGTVSPQDRYVTSATTTGGQTDLAYSQNTKPSNVYIDTNASFTVYKNKSFQLHMQSTDAMKWCHAIVFFDWNGDGTFEAQSQKIGYDAGEYANLPTEGNPGVCNFTIDVTVPANAVIGETRMRVQYTDAWHNQDVAGHSHSAMDEIDRGGCYDFIMNIVAMPYRTITLTSDENGTATITSPTEGVTDNSITTDQPVTISATPNEGYMFVNWTNGDSEFSKENPYTYNNPEDITLRANFKIGSYPEMKRFFENGTSQQNRYLEKVTYTIEGTETTIFEATTQENLPYTAILSTATGSGYKATTEGAIIDKTATSIIIPEGSASFDMKFKVWNKAIDGNNQELVWTKQAYYIDLNNDFYFSGSTDNVNEISASTVSNTGDSNNFDDENGSVENGWTRTINLPSTLAPGTYRMRVVYYEPGDADWNEKLFTELNGVIRNGIAYDFIIEIISADTERTVTVESNGGGNVSITSPAGVQGNFVTTKEDVTVSAEPNPGYEFVNWTNKDGGEEVSKSNPYTYLGLNNITLVANFEKIRNLNLTTIKGTLNSNGQFLDGYIVRGNIPIEIIGESNALTMAAWVNIEGPSTSSMDKGSVDWGSSENMGKVVIGTRQNDLTGYGSDPAFAVNVCGADYTKDTYKLGLYVKGGAKHLTGIEMPKGWYHLAFTLNYDGANTAIKMFINGICTAEAEAAGSFEKFNDLCLGDNMNAQFDDVMIWAKALETNEIKASMKGFTDDEIKSQTDLVGYFTCDDLKDGNAVSKNLVEGSTYNLRRDKMSYSYNTSKWAYPCSKSDYTSGETVSERSTPRGGDKFYDNDTEAEWNGNGDEEFGYIVNSETITHLDYNGYDKVKLPEGTVAVYHNGEPGLPVYVTADDYEIVNGNTETTSSYVVSGLEYTVTMPAGKVWMPLSLPENVDLVHDNDDAVNLRPMWNFWYSTFNSEYADAESYSDIWNSFEKVEGETDSKTYELIQPGIISVPETRAGHSFTFYTKIDKPVVVRALNAEYNASLMPSEAGKIKFVTNPYSFSVNTSELVTSGMDIYRFNETSGNFDIVTEASDLNVYEPVMIFNNGGGAFKSPRYIGTKAVSGIIEYEAVYDVNVRGTEGAVEVETFIPADVEIFDTNGMAVAAGHVEGTHRFTLETGIYIVRTVVEGNTETFKVVVE